MADSAAIWCLGMSMERERSNRSGPKADFWWVTVSYPAGLAPYLIHRGSIAIDGISLTIATLEKTTLDVQIVPFTWSHTNLRSGAPAIA